VIHFATVAGPVSRVIGDLRQSLAHPVECVNVIQASEMIGILHANDNAYLAFRLCPREVVRVIHAHEIVRMLVDKSVPVREPLQGDGVRLAGLKRHCRVEYVDPGVAQLLKVVFSESTWGSMPLIEQRPVQGQQAQHVDNVRLSDQVDGPSRVST